MAADGEATDTLYSDVFDRGGRGDNRLGNDWLIGSAECAKYEHEVRAHAETLQEGNTSQMIHDVFEFTAYGSNIVTLRPGDVIGTGTPAGVGSARTPPIYLKDDGDRA